MKFSPLEPSIRRLRNQVITHNMPQSGHLSANSQALTPRHLRTVVESKMANPPLSGLARFDYETLDYTKREIRLIRLVQSDQPEYDLKCELETFRLDKAPPYRALSYVWGDPADTKPLLLGGRHHDITTNLHAALKVIRDMPRSNEDLGEEMYLWMLNFFVNREGETLRRVQHTDHLWVDAICINQKDIAEKSRQIPLMEDIYGDADSALVWLGEESLNSTTAMAFIKGCARAWNLVMENCPDLRFDSSNQDPVQLAMAYLQITSSVDPMDEANWEAVNEFAQRTLWSRVWIVQEVSLSERAVVLCGPERILLEDLFVFCKLQTALFAQATTETARRQLGEARLMPMLASSIRRIGTFVDLRMALQSLKTTVSNNSLEILQLKAKTLFDLAETPAPNNFAHILPKLSSFQATDARDHVYGLLGLYHKLIPSQTRPALPDYSIPASVVYRNFTQQYVEATNDLGICVLNGISFPTTYRGDLPSWVPDLSAPTYHNSTIGHVGYSAAAGTPARVLGFSDDGTVMRVSGLVCDKITGVEDIDQTLPVDQDGAWDVFGRWTRLAASQNRKYHPTGMPWKQALFRNISRISAEKATLRPEQRDEGLEKHFFVLFNGLLELLNSEVGSAELGKMPGDMQLADPAGQRHRSLDRLSQLQALSIRWSWYLPDSSDAPGPHDQLREIFGAESARGPSDLPFLRFVSFDDPIAGTPSVVASAATARMCSFFVTESGYTGLTPGTVRAGDKVAVLLGCDWPVVIRPEGDHHLIVAAAFVYGMMNGEVMDAEREGKFQREELSFK